MAMRFARAAALTPPLLVLILYCWYRWRYRRVLIAARNLPSAAPTLKVLTDCHKSPVGFVNLVMFMINTAKALVARGRRTLCMWIGPYPVIVVQGADDAKGAETTRAVICSCLLSLAADPDIQERLFEEIVSVAGAQDKNVTLEQLNRMLYLDQVFKETIRKFSVVPLFMRKALEDTHLSECVGPEGATVAISLVSLQYDPAAFPDPERFDPSRFAPENLNSINKFNYIPFSAGSRNCIGKWYAAQTVKTAVIHTLRRYRLTTDVDPSALRYHWGLAMTSYDGHHVRLHPRST